MEAKARSVLLDSEACRARAGEFSVNRMRERYEAAYESVLAERAVPSGSAATAVPPTEAHVAGLAT